MCVGENEGSFLERNSVIKMIEKKKIMLFVPQKNMNFIPYNFDPLCNL